MATVSNCARDAAIALSLLLTACSGDGRTAATAPRTEVAIASSRLAPGAGDALVPALLSSAGVALSHAGRPPFRMADGMLAAELTERAVAHLEASALAAGGAGLEGSDLIRRLAAATSAPPDRNGNGTNLDETLADSVDKLAQAVAMPAPRARQVGLPAAVTDADYLASVAAVGRRDYHRQAVRPSGDRTVDARQLAHAMQARLILAQAVLRNGTGPLAASGDPRGLVALLALQQALAMETTALDSLFYDGLAMGRIDPRTYDPSVEPQWLPRRFRYTDEPGLPGVPDAYLVVDRASDLAALGGLLHAASELAWMVSPRSPHRALAALIAGPLYELPVSGGPIGPPPPNWDDDIGPLTRFWCWGCHFDPVEFAFANFSVEDYEATLRGGRNNTMFPAVVPGDHRASLMWQVLVGPTSVSAQMPKSTAVPPVTLDQEDIDMVAAWIDAGAPEKAPPPVQGPQQGLDLARVLLANLEALHLDASGAMHHRHEGDAASGFAEPGPTGAVLRALVAFLAVEPGDPSASALLRAAADYASSVLVDADGWMPEVVRVDARARSGVAGLSAHAQLTAGLLAAGRTGHAAARDAGRRAVAVLLDEFWDDAAERFSETPGGAGVIYDPDLLAALLAALREAAADGEVRAGTIHDRLLRRLRPHLVFSEWGARGEVIGDGIADTDGNGVPEPALAGGTHGRAPMFAGEIRDGVPAPAISAAITWSEHIQPLFRQKCAQCHLDGAQRGAYRLDSPALLRVPGESGGQWPLVVAGDPEASLLYRKLVDRNPAVGVQMPEAQPPLSPAAKELVRQWILQGAEGR